MRVISGVAKGRKLVSFKGSDIRPTSDRARESLFNIIGERAKNCSFLDLYAGSGAMGIEALSRGAEKVVFVENQAASISLIKKNLEKCDLLDLDCELIQKDVLIFLKTIKIKFDIVFVDPPYNTDLAEKSLLCLSEKNMLKPDGIIILEHHRTSNTQEEIKSLKKIRTKKIGNAAFSFFIQVFKTWP